MSIEYDEAEEGYPMSPRQDAMTEMDLLDGFHADWEPSEIWSMQTCPECGAPALCKTVSPDTPFTLMCHSCGWPAIQNGAKVALEQVITE